MAKRVVWSARALADVESIAAYIASDSPAYAKIVVKKIVKLTRQLARFPSQAVKFSNFKTNLSESCSPIAIASFTKSEQKRSSSPA
jgi:plasmid stabilization system protein ParE